MTDSGSELYRERKQRIDNAIRLKRTDRVPLWFQDSGWFPARYTGITLQEAVYDYDKFSNSMKKTILDFQPDIFLNIGNRPGQMLDILDSRQYKWPGQTGTNPNFTVQFVEGEYLRADEYDAFLSDPSDWIIRTYLPRTFGALQPMANLPDFKLLLRGIAGPAIAAANPEILNAVKNYYKAGLILIKQAEKARQFQREMESLGYPSACGTTLTISFDLVSDFLRGMRGTVMDMYRQPSKLLAAIDMLTPLLIDRTIKDAETSGTSAVFITLHRGADGFMSRKQYETFYWPSLKKILLALIEHNITPYAFFEGNYTSRLDFLKELPKGKILGCFDSTDLYEVKKVLGNIMCISGLMPLSLLQAGSPDQIKEHTKKLIDVVGKDGGFIMAPQGAMNECDPARVKIWVDFTREYGVYP